MDQRGLTEIRREEKAIEHFLAKQIHCHRHSCEGGNPASVDTLLKSGIFEMDIAEQGIGIEREIEFQASPEAGKILAYDSAKGLNFLLAAFL
jgi:hypothetical protein